MRSSGLPFLLLITFIWTNPATAQTNFPPDKNPRYFPPGVFTETGDNGDFKAHWFGSSLRALKEPSISEVAAGADSVYRFLWLRTFHYPIAVRIILRRNGTGTLTVKMSNGQGGYEPGTMIVNSSRALTSKETAPILELVAALDFWHAPTEPANPIAPDGTVQVGLDGAQWILEGLQNGKYHVIDRWSPKKALFASWGSTSRSR